MARMWMILFAGVLAAAAAPAHALGSRPQEPVRERAPGSSVERIAEALRAGEIDEDTATLYRVYAAVDEGKLPERYRGGGPIRDATPILRDARSRYDELRPEIQEALRPYLFPRDR